MTDTAKKKLVLKPKAQSKALPVPITNAVAAQRLYGKKEDAAKPAADAKKA